VSVQLLTLQDTWKHELFMCKQIADGVWHLFKYSKASGAFTLIPTLSDAGMALHDHLRDNGINV